MISRTLSAALFQVGLASSMQCRTVHLIHLSDLNTFNNTFAIPIAPIVVNKPFTLVNLNTKCALGNIQFKVRTVPRYRTTLLMDASRQA